MSCQLFVMFTQPCPANCGDVMYYRSMETDSFQMNIHFCPGNPNILKLFVELKSCVSRFFTRLKIFLNFLSPSTDDLLSKEAGQCYETAGWSKAASAAK